MDRWRSQEDLRHEVAVIVPVYFSPRVDDETVARLVPDRRRSTTGGAPEQVWLVVDGDRAARDFCIRSWIACRRAPGICD